MNSRTILLCAALPAAAAHAVARGVSLPPLTPLHVTRRAALAAPHMTAEVDRVREFARAPLKLSTLGRYARGEVGVDRVPCADEGDQQCYALCDESECSVIGETSHWDTAKVSICSSEHEVTPNSLGCGWNARALLPNAAARALRT